MCRITRPFATLLLPILGMAACERTKSANPLSPSIAGPIAGVEISAPQPVQPSAGSQVASDTQPISLVVQNAKTTGVRPLTYVFEIASDSGFATKVFSQTGVTPGTNGQTSVRLPQNLSAERTYYWRSKADDGANASGFSAPTDFRVYTPVIIQAPAPIGPGDGVTTATPKPTLEVSNAAVAGPAGPLSYLFEVATDGAMANKVVSVEVGQQNGRTSYTVPSDLNPSTRYFWRVRAFDAGHVGPYSTVRSFVTPAIVVVVPVPPPTGGGGPQAGDQIDLSQSTIVLGPANIGAWPVTSTISSATAQTGGLCINHTKLGQWPRTIFFDDPNTLLEGNQWVFALINGRWYGGAADWYRPGQACKDVTAQSIGGDAFYSPSQEPLHSWVPRPGEQIGVMSTTPARAYPAMKTVDERTNIVLIRWGG